MSPQVFSFCWQAAVRNASKGHTPRLRARTRRALLLPSGQTTVELVDCLLRVCSSLELDYSCALNQKELLQTCRSCRTGCGIGRPGRQLRRESSVKSGYFEFGVHDRVVQVTHVHRCVAGLLLPRIIPRTIVSLLICAYSFFMFRDPSIRFFLFLRSAGCLWLLQSS